MENNFGYDSQNNNNGMFNTHRSAFNSTSNGLHATSQNSAVSNHLPVPWEIEVSTTGGKAKPWNELKSKAKWVRVLTGVGKAVGLLTCLYFFVCSLDTLSLGFRVLGGRTTGKLFRQSEILKNPVVGMMVGVFTTVLVQSSSTSTSIIVSMVAAEFLDVHVAVPIVMGANIGTSITNTIVSLTQAGDRAQFRRAFAGATVHDMFNWLTVIVLLIVEVTTGYLEKVTGIIMDNLVDENSTRDGKIEILGVITKPLVHLIVEIDKKVLECWSQENCTKHDNASLIKRDCTKSSKLITADSQINNLTLENIPLTTAASAQIECNSLFAKLNLGDTLAGCIILIGSFIVLCGCLMLIVKILNSVLQGQIAIIIKKTLNAKVPYVPWITGYLAILVGAIMTFLVQSSSVFTSALTPLVGLGVLTVERVYPLTLGSNVGTTTTALLASMAAKGRSFKPSVQIALCHLLFNVTGILLFYPIPFLRFPIPMAKFLGAITSKYRWFAIFYMFFMFFALPGLFMGLSFAGTYYVIAAATAICSIFLFVTSVNLMRRKCPSVLPAFLESWKWMPVWFRSLEPYDRIFSKISCCKKLKKQSDTEQVVMDDFRFSRNGTNLSTTYVNRGFTE